MIAAVAKNGVIGNQGGIPWHLPEDFRHFKQSTLHQTLLMGRATFDSIGKPLVDRETIVLTRDPTWRYPGVHTAHDLQDAILMANELPGNLMVVGGGHIYASTLPAAHMQVISKIDASPLGDAFYPTWDPLEWQLSESEERAGFSIETWTRQPVMEQLLRFELAPSAAAMWWGSDWQSRLTKAVRRQRRTSESGVVNWTSVHAAATRVIVEAAEDYARHGLAGAPEAPREVRLSRHLSMEDIHAIQGSLFHWAEFVAPRRALK